MKKIICILCCILLSIVLFTFTACNKGSGESHSLSPATVATEKVKPTEKPTEKQTEKPTEKPTEKFIHELIDIIEDDYYYDSNYNSLPLILLNSSGANSINSEIKNIWDNRNNPFKHYYQYDVYYYDGILSIVINEKVDGGDNQNYVYVLDTCSGKEMSSSDVASYFGMNRDEAYSKLKDKLNSEYYDKNSQNLNVAGDTAQHYIDKTFSQDNIDASELYIDNSGRLCGSCKTYVPVGGDGPKAMTFIIN